MPFEVTFNSVLLQETEIEGFAYSPPAPAEFDKSGNTAVGQIFDFAATTAAQLGVSVRRKRASKAPIKDKGRNFFIPED
jgi:hypothetical protein